MKKNKILSLFIFFNFISFIIGFIYLEEHGASILDANLHTYPAIEGLRLNFFNNIVNYGKYGENSYPLHHIMHALLNPFGTGTFLYKIFSCLLSGLVLFFFYKSLNLRFKITQIKAIFLTSLILISPYFRSSAFWGLTENTGLIFLTISIFFFNKYLKNINLSYNLLILISLFSSLALYSRVQYIFLCIFFYLFFLISKILVKEKILITIFYLILSFPGLFLIFLWGGLIDEQYAGEFSYFINIQAVPSTLLVIFSLIGFYSLPFILIINRNFLLLIKNFFLEYLLAFFICVLIYIIFRVDIFFLNELRDYVYGQGFVSNLTYKITKIESSYLIFSSIGLVVLKRLFNISSKNKLIILSIISIFSLRVHFFTEYLDPLMYILFFTLLDFNKNKILFSLKSLFILELFFVGILIGAILI